MKKSTSNKIRLRSIWYSKSHPQATFYTLNSVLCHQTICGTNWKLVGIRHTFSGLTRNFTEVGMEVESRVEFPSAKYDADYVKQTLRGEGATMHRLDLQV